MKPAAAAWSNWITALGRIGLPQATTLVRLHKCSRRVYFNSIAAAGPKTPSCRNEPQQQQDTRLRLHADRGRHIDIDNPNDAMETKLNEDHLLAQFDRLVAEGMVVYSGDHHTITVSDKGLSFEFRILNSHDNKPQAPRDPRNHMASEQSGCRPGGDISISGYEIATLGTTHVLMANKFPSARPHLLILTQDGFKRQFEALDIDDLAAAREVVSSLKSRYLLLFNCGIDGGCSRLHKHMQLFPAPDPNKFALWADASEPKLPFKFFIHRFPAGLPPADELLRIYRALLRRAERALEYAALEGEAAVPHNVIMDRNWLVVIPRRAAGWDGVGANAAGMLGMVWVNNEEKVKTWLARGPAAMLARLGVPADAAYE